MRINPDIFRNDDDGVHHLVSSFFTVYGINDSPRAHRGDPRGGARVYGGRGSPASAAAVLHIHTWESRVAFTDCITAAASERATRVERIFLEEE